MNDDARLVRLVRDELAHLRGNSRVVDADLVDEFPREALAHQELSLTTPLAIRLVWRFVPILALHDFGVDELVHAAKIIGELGNSQVGMAIREAPSLARRRGGLDGRNQMQHGGLATLIALNRSRMDRVKHRRTRREIEWDVIGERSTGRERDLPLSAALLDVLMSDSDDGKPLLATAVVAPKPISLQDAGQVADMGDVIDRRQMSLISAGRFVALGRSIKRPNIFELLE